MGILRGIKGLYVQWVWPTNLEQAPAYRRYPLRALRIVIALISDFREGDITLRAMSLVYTTLVSLVPLLALAFSLLKAFGVDNALRPTLERFLAPLGSGSAEIVDKIVDFVSNVQVGVLGAIGVVALIYSVLSLIQKVEEGCNFIWKVKKSRPLARRISEYISVLVMGPLVILAATSATASLRANSTLSYVSHFDLYGPVMLAFGHLLPYVLYSAGFTLLFKLVPNTRVHLLAALGGGIFSGVLWQTASSGFALFARNAGNVNAIYSSFAILILLLIWLYVSWMILLLGCRAAYWIQHPERLTLAPYPPRLGAAAAERLTVTIAVIVARHFLEARTMPDAESLATRLGHASEHVHTAISRLTDAGVLVEAASRNHTTTLIPSRDLARIRVMDILTIIRCGDARPQTAQSSAPHEIDMHRCDRLLDRAEAARDAVIGELTLRELAATTAHNGEPELAQRDHALNDPTP